MVSPPADLRHSFIEPLNTLTTLVSASDPMNRYRFSDAGLCGWLAACDHVMFVDS
jgi:hypothetical protein